MPLTNPFGRRGRLRRSRGIKRVKPPDEFEGRPVYLIQEEWNRRVVELVDSLPWFGQDILPPPARSRRRRRGEPLPSEDHRRVLLSWLAGGSAALVGRRVNVSRRSVYNVIRRFVYSSDPVASMTDWHDLGLIACLATPGCVRLNSSINWQEVICLICHDRVTTYDWEAPKLGVGTAFRPEPRHHMPRINADRSAGFAQGHLILHYWLDDYPIPYGWNALSSTDARSSVGRWASQYVEENFRVREAATAAVGSGVIDDPEQWRSWRLRLLESGRQGSILPPLQIPAQTRRP